jgi:hypothetical protein
MICIVIISHNTRQDKNRASECCLTPTQQLFSYILSRTSEFSMIFENHIGGVMVSVLASSAIDHVFKPRSGKTNHHKIGIGIKHHKPDGRMTHAALNTISPIPGGRMTRAALNTISLTDG